MNLETGVSEQQIVAAEKQLSVSLPEEYKQLLSFSNGVA
jgi:cell wall assembly regulator SMI1